MFKLNLIVIKNEWMKFIVVSNKRKMLSINGLIKNSVDVKKYTRIINGEKIKLLAIPFILNSLLIKIIIVVETIQQFKMILVFLKTSFWHLAVNITT